LENQLVTDGSCSSNAPTVTWLGLV